MFNVMIGQSGGPTCAINASLAGIIGECLKAPEIGRIYGMIGGIEGVLNDNIVDITSLFADGAEEKLALLSSTPSSALGSCRIKLPEPGTAEGDRVYGRIFSVLEKYSVGAFFYIGGNDSMDTVKKLFQIAESRSCSTRFIGVPKTIDNDIVMTDHTPGYGSAAKYVASTVQDIAADCSVYSVKSVTIVEIMGRDSGWLTAAAALPSLHGYGPDYVYMPEVPFDVDSFLADIEKAHGRHPGVLVCVSEGVKDRSGEYAGSSDMSGKADVFGNKYLAGIARYLEHVVRERLGCKARGFGLSIPQRCASYLMSATDIAESEDAGRTAVRAMLGGATGIMVNFIRQGEPYRIEYSTVDVARVAKKVKYVPSDYIRPSGNMVTKACFDYILPLTEGEVPQRYEKGMPAYLPAGFFRK